MDLIILLAVLFSIVWTFVVLLKPNSKSAKLPPGPYQYPVIGNILSLGQNPHQSLTKLSKVYGPLMSLKLGSCTAIVVSSPEIAKIVLQTHDQVLSSRTVPSPAYALSHNEYSIPLLPVNNRWRKLRKICKEKMFSVASLDASSNLRIEKLNKLSDYVKLCSENDQAVDIEKATFTTALNLLSASLFSREFADYDSESTQEMRDIVCSIFSKVGTPSLMDFFPALLSLDPQGILKETKGYFEKLFSVFDGFIEEKLKTMEVKSKINEENKKRDLLETLLDLNKTDESEFSLFEIKHLLLDLFIAGTDTISATTEWAMAELLRHPEIISRVRREITEAMEENKEIQESDISKFPYLQAVVKETFRVHPAVPFLLPRKAEADVDINGYMIPKNAQILINIWATGRDSSVWKNADSFMPERFMDNCSTDFKGSDFELIPFGSGRRICPGMPLAYRVVHLMLATFIHKFDWKLEDGIKPQEIDMTEKFGLTLLKAIPLKATPTKLSSVYTSTS